MSPQESALLMGVDISWMRLVSYLKRVQRDPLHLLSHEDTTWSLPHRALTRLWWHPDLRLQPLKLWAIHFCLKATQSLVLCYIILTRLRQVTKDCGFYTAHSLSISRSLSFARLTEARCLVASCTVERLTRHDDPNNPRGTESGWQARARTRRRGLPPQSRDDCSLVWDAEQEAPATPHLDPWATEDATAPHLLF